MGYTHKVPGWHIAQTKQTKYENRLDMTIKIIHHILIVSRPNSEPQWSADAGGIPPGLSAEQLTLLSLIRLVRVTVDSLAVPTGSTTTTPRKASNKGKPPRPLTSKKW